MPLVTAAAPGVRDDLREKEIMLTSAQRLAGVGAWVQDLPSGQVRWSDETYRLLGLDRQVADGGFEALLAHVHPEDREVLRELNARALAGERHFSYRYRITGRDGRERLIAGDGEGQYDEDGNLVRLIGTVMDITERERERQAIRDSEQRFRRLVALSSDGYWQQDSELRFTEFSHGRYPAEERLPHFVGKRRWELPDIDPLNTSWEEHQALLAARQPFRDLELRHSLPSGERYVSVSGEPFHDADGRFLGYRGTATDITERKVAEERVRQVNASLRMAMRLGRIGVWSMELPSSRLHWWNGGRMVYAVDGSPSASFDQLLQRVDPLQRAGLRSAMQRCVEHGEAFDLEVLLQAAVHPLLWVRLIAEPHRDEQGRIRQVQGTVQDVTERRLAAERARELGTRLAATLDTASDAFLTVNRDWQISYLNHEAERLLRRPREQLLGHDLWRAFPRLQGSRYEREYLRALAEGVTVEFEEFFEPLRLWLQVRACPSPQGLAIYFRDISDSHSIQQALADSQEQLRNLFENTIDGVVYKGPGHRVVRANPAACAMLARSGAQLHGTDFTTLVSGGAQSLGPLWEQRAMTGRASGQLTLIRGDGSTFPAEVSTAEYTAADGTLRAFMVFRDISQRLEAQQQILQLNAELGERVRQRTAELEAANADLKAFAHSLAHDLQSPVAAIDGYSQMLEGVLPKPLPERAAHYLGRIRSAARKGAEYAQGLLGLARVSQATLVMGTVDLGAIATDLLTQLAERDRDRAVQWHVQEGLHVRGDATLLRMALDNLLGNAWKFTRGRDPARIEFAAQAGADGETVFRVRDNGAGFDMACAHRLFGNFQRLHTQDQFPGTGVGLANVQRVIARHGGRVWAEGTPGEGASFYFTLPLPSSENEKRAP